MAVKRWTGSTWEIYAGADTSPGFAATDGRAGRRVWVGANTPTAPTDGDIWIDQDTATNSIPASAFDAKGDLMVGTGPDTYTRQAVGTDGQVLVADSTQADGVVWSHTPSRQGLMNIVPTSVSVGSGTGTVSSNGLVTFSGAIGIGLNNCFSSLHQNYRILLNITSMPTAASIRVRFRTSGTDDATAAYNWASAYYLTSNNFQSLRSTSANEGSIGYGLGQDRQQASIEVYSPNLSTTNTAASYSGSHGAGDINWNGAFGHNSATAFDGINIFTSNGGVITGTIRVYGYNNGA